MENSPEVKSENIEFGPDIKQEKFECPQGVKSETIEYPSDVKSEAVTYQQGISPTKRLKTLNIDSSSPSSKGKSKIEKEDDDSLSEQQLDSCGVCLLEEGMSIRGIIDSCDHYFCFVCIMEWAKVESRCPICKRRFSTIRRPPKDGIFLSERIVDVPVRDQVHYYDGNATIGPSDPYSQVKCTVCTLTTDDHLLLLCDLCDSAAHSYCIGLGATVPEGDWFCHDCNLSRDEHSKIESQTCESQTCDSQTFASNSNVVQSTGPRVSIHDIVRESPEPRRSSIAASFRRNEIGHGRTLQRCLNVHARIKVLRENWDGFRGGSLTFSSSFGDGQRAGQRKSFSSNQKSSSQNNQSSSVSQNGGSYNVDRAWKMMDIATKAIGRKCGKKSSGDRDSKHPVRLPKETYKAKLKPITPKFKHFGVSEKQYSSCPSFRNVITSSQVNMCGGNGEILSRKDNLGARASNIVGSGEGSSSFIRPPLMATEKLCDKEEMGETKKVPQVDKKSQNLEDAKSEIQSLVKLNLKILSRAKKLEVDVFKEVARHATHSILGACGLEEAKAKYRTFPTLVCNHVNENSKHPRSTLMPTCCRECFFVFVKDVVNTITLDRPPNSSKTLTRLP